MSLKELEEAIKNRPTIKGKESETKTLLLMAIALDMEEWFEDFEACFDAFKKQLRKLAKKVEEKYNFESGQTELDRKSGYPIFKIQQDFVNFLAWLNSELKKVLEGNK